MADPVRGPQAKHVPEGAYIVQLFEPGRVLRVVHRGRRWVECVTRDGRYVEVPRQELVLRVGKPKTWPRGW